MTIASVSPYIKVSHKLKDGRKDGRRGDAENEESGKR